MRFPRPLYRMHSLLILVALVAVALGGMRWMDR
jgi:hypothetical protein